MAEFKLEGFAEFEKQLQQLGEGYRSDLVARNTLVKAVKEALVPAYNSAFAKAAYGPPNPYGIHMKDTMRIDGRIPNNKDKLSDFVSESDAVIGVLSVKKSAVSLANEFGTSKMAAQPFLRSGFESAIQEVLNNLKSELTNLIPAYAKKLQKRGIK
jgi:HK97 gp10 family phage protein